MKNKLFLNILDLYKWLKFKRKIQFFLVIGFSLFVSVMEMVTVGSLVPFVSSIIDSTPSFASEYIFLLKEILKIADKNTLILILASTFVLLSVITALCRSLLIYITARFANLVLSELGSALYNQKLSEPYIKFISKGSDEMISLISTKLFQIYGVIFGVLQFITSLILLLSIALILIFIDSKLTLISLSVFGSLYILVILFFRKTLKKNSKIISNNTRLMVKSLQEGVGSIRDIILENNQKFYINNFSKLMFERGFKIAINDLLSLSPRFLLEVIGIILISTFLYYYNDNSGGIINLFPVLSALALGAQKIMPLMNLLYVNYASAVASSHQLNEAIEILRKRKNSTEIESLSIEKIDFNSRILIKNVSFRYKEDLPLILENINLEIKKGSKIGIIGKTGVGKSTVLDIVMGLLSPTMGEIYVDNKKIDHKNCISWRKKTTHVPQDIFLINGTILENIALGLNLNEIDYLKVENCAKYAEIYNFINSLDNKFQENVGERGIKLSGGQKQRIGIARALYRDSDLIIFDEATNALDLNTENKIINSISNLKDSTIVMVTHRVESLRICDKVYEIDKNSIIEKKI